MPLSDGIAARATEVRAAAAIPIYVASRVVVLVCAALSITVINRDPAVGSWPRVGGGSRLLQVLARWDGACVYRERALDPADVRDIVA